jgi:hypothetical protein
MFKHWPSLPSSVGRTQKVFAARSRVGSRSLRQSPSGWPTGAMARGTRRPLQEVGNSWLVPPLTTAWRKPEAPAMPSCAPLVLLGCSSAVSLVLAGLLPAISLLTPAASWHHHRAPAAVRQHEFSHYSNEVVFDFTPSKWGLFTSTVTVAWITDDSCRKTASRVTIA